MKKRDFLRIIFVVIILLKLTFIFLNAPKQNSDFKSLKKIWLHSQYNLNQGYEFFGNMSDEDLRTFASLEYMQGKDPSDVNFEDPPLAKYVFGFSHLFFGNILLVQFLISLVIVILTFLFAGRLQIPSPLNLLPSLALIFDPLFVERSTTVNLDLPQLMFVLLALFLLTSRKFSRRRQLLVGVSVGAAMASKVVITGLLLLLFVLVVLVIRRLPKLKESLLLITASSFLVYIFSYSFFLLYNSPFDFVLLHLKIARLYRSYLPEYPWFEIWRILFLGKWRTWFADPLIQPVKEFWLAWPLSAIFTMLIVVDNKFRSLPIKPEQILFGWIVIYLFFQSTHVVFPRYLLLSLPCLYILGFSSIIKLLHKLAQL